MMADSNISFKALLIHLSEILKEEDLKRMKFMCKDIIKTKEIEKITSPLDLWTALEQREHLSQSNLVFLKNLLKDCTNGNLIPLRCVENYEQVLQGQNLNHLHAQVTQPVIVGNQGPAPQYIYVTQDQRQNMPIPGPKYEGPDLRKEFSFLTDRLGKDWKFYIRALGLRDDEIDIVSQENRRVREQIYQCLKIWQTNEQQAASRAKLAAALRDCAVQRFDLALEIDSL